ncbi:MAG: hypothetical protein IJR82_01060 [Bacilli bacterium]|nr:hypothetical protein [Bacilli bacterium]
MKNKNKIILPIVTGILVSSVIIGTSILFNSQKKNDSEKNISSSQETLKNENNSNNSNSDNKETLKNENNSNNSNSDNKNNIQATVNGIYSVKTDNGHYREINLEISNKTNSSIDFKLSGTAGVDVNHVSIGDVSGIATIIDIPQDSIIPESEQYAYQFVDNVDGKTYKITFVYTAHKSFEYVNIIEEYPDNFNPYAGHGVYFTGELEKVYK